MNKDEIDFLQRISQTLKNLMLQLKFVSNDIDEFVQKYISNHQKAKKRRP